MTSTTRRSTATDNNNNNNNENQVPAGTAASTNLGLQRGGTSAAATAPQAQQQQQQLPPLPPPYSATTTASLQQQQQPQSLGVAASSSSAASDAEQSYSLVRDYGYTPPGTPTALLRSSRDSRSFGQDDEDEDNNNNNHGHPYHHQPVATTPASQAAAAALAQQQQPTLRFSPLRGGRTHNTNNNTTMSPSNASLLDLEADDNHPEDTATLQNQEDVDGYLLVDADGNTNSADVMDYDVYRRSTEEQDNTITPTSHNHGQQPTGDGLFRMDVAPEIASVTSADSNMQGGRLWRMAGEQVSNLVGLRRNTDHTTAPPPAPAANPDAAQHLLQQQQLQFQQLQAPQHQNINKQDEEDDVLSLASSDGSSFSLPRRRSAAFSSFKSHQKHQQQQQQQQAARKASRTAGAPPVATSRNTGANSSNSKASSSVAAPTAASAQAGPNPHANASSSRMRLADTFLIKTQSRADPDTVWVVQQQQQQAGGSGNNNHHASSTGGGTSGAGYGRLANSAAAMRYSNNPTPTQVLLQHQQQEDDEDHKTALRSSALAHKRVRVVQLLLIGLIGLFVVWVGSFWVGYSCHFFSMNVPVGQNGNEFPLHVGLWKYSPADSALNGYSYCYPYRNPDDAPKVARGLHLAALIAGTYSLFVLWYYLIVGQTTFGFWVAAVWAARLAALCQVCTLASFYWGSLCRTHVCETGPASGWTMLTALAWMVFAWELSYNNVVLGGGTPAVGMNNTFYEDENHPFHNSILISDASESGHHQAPMEPLVAAASPAPTQSFSPTTTMAATGLPPRSRRGLDDPRAAAPSPFHVAATLQQQARVDLNGVGSHHAAAASTTQDAKDEKTTAKNGGSRLPEDTAVSVVNLEMADWAGASQEYMDRCHDWRASSPQVMVMHPTPPPQQHYQQQYQQQQPYGHTAAISPNGSYRPPELS